MALTYYPEELYAYPDDWPHDDQFASADIHAPRQSWRPDALTLAAIILLAFLGLRLLADHARPQDQVSPPAPPAVAIPRPGAQLAPAAPLPQPFASPYDSFWVTQGLHGAWYGHLAVDLKAGQGTPIKSPIDGAISARYLDGLGNTVLVIENDQYQVTLMHGEYTVAVADPVTQGQVVGSESNIGNTTDSLGRSCRGRDCGYHTHLNVFDKLLGRNVNPLDLLPS
jgi:murein DD-endopeptidase MepM/ murein hydrolase activator NlpD